MTVNKLVPSLKISYVLGAAATVLLAILLAWSSNRYQSLDGWFNFLGVIWLAVGVLWLGWRLLRGEAPPAWSARLLVLAALLRLAAGLLWYGILPVYGHGSPPEQAGYVMADAFQRDQASWDLAQSDQPLWTAFINNRTAVDQYGGMLFVSSALYRYLGGEQHQPLMVIVLTAVFSALAVVYTWAFARRAWGERVACLAAWFLAFYPEAVLLGSSQMREAFSLPLVAMSFYGLVRFSGLSGGTAVVKHDGGGLVWLVVPLLLDLLFSPPLAALTLVLLGVVALGLRRQLFKINAHLSRRWTWLLLVGLGVVVLVGAWLALRKLTPQHITSPLAVLSWWLRKTSDWQIYQSRHASGWMQKIFKNTPQWIHLPLLLVYGVAQPFFPAALAATSAAPAWTWIVVWRAAGWTVLLFLLFYATLRSWNRSISSGLVRSMVIAVWLSILVAAYRAGGDLWDSPRYRAAFAALQVSLAAWAWVQAGGVASAVSGRRAGLDPVLRRSVMAAILLGVWLFGWYLHRYVSLPFPVEAPFAVLGIGLAGAGLYALGDWAWSRRNRGT